jgi:hypothetical protein
MTPPERQNPERLTVTGPEDILGFIPHSLGYWPANSLVAMTMQGKRLGATLRVDLPVLDSDAGLSRFTGTVREYLESDQDADGTLLVLFSNDGWIDRTGSAAGSVPDPAAESLKRLLSALEDELESSGRPVRDAWFVGHEFWRNAYCCDPSCCPAPGRSVDEIRNSRLNAEMVYRGSSVGEDPSSAAIAPPEGAPANASVVESEEKWAREFVARRASRAQFARIMDVWGAVLAAAPGDTHPAGLAGYLRASLRIPHWRDAVLVMSAAGRRAAEQGVDEFGIFDPDVRLPVVSPPLAVPPAVVPDDDAAYPVPGYGDVLLGLAPGSPRWDRMRALERVLQQLGAAGGGESGAAALTGRGWIEWCRGRGSFAHALLERAAAEHPGYRLAALLSELVSRGTLCGWAGRRDSAWQKFETDAA